MDIDYRLIRSARRSVQLEFDNAGSLILRVPKRISEHEIERILNLRSEWIAKAKQKMTERGVSTPKKFVEGEYYLYLGSEYILTFIDAYFSGARFEADQIQLSTSYELKAKSCLTKWYKKTAFDYFIQRLNCFSKIMNLKYHEAKLSSAGRRWGSCSHNGNINLNWKLIMAPPNIIDYVIVHELAHLAQPNHSAKFWAVVENIAPNYKSERKWLKENGQKLTF